jgi:hypothetical protein
LTVRRLLQGIPFHLRGPISAPGIRVHTLIMGPINLLVRMVVRSAIPRRCSIEIHAS